MENKNRFGSTLIAYIVRLRKFRVPLIVSFYLLSVLVSYLGAFYIRFDFMIPERYWLIIRHTFLILFVSRLLTHSMFRDYRSSWQFTSLHDVVDIVKGGMLGSVIFLALIAFMGKMDDFPRSIIVIEAIINIFFISGIRLFFRYGYEGAGREPFHKAHKRALIVGAGYGGMLALNEMRRDQKSGIVPVGFVDDDPHLKGTRRQGVIVFGNTNKIPDLVSQHAIDEVVVAIPSATHKDIVRISDICKSVSIAVRVLPSVGEIIRDGAYNTGRLKEVLIDDLLGRKIIRFSEKSDLVRLNQELKGKCVLITGAGGSIGSELCRQAATYHPRLLIMYERHETSLSDIEIDMRKDFPHQPILPVLGDILDTKKVDKVLQMYSVDLIYHAAAYKHVPVIEREPLEAVRNNIFGTFRLGELAVKHGVKKFIMISTDKAVKPSSIMGATKRVAELIVQSLNEKSVTDSRHTQFISVRFGNVIGSNGSVLPLFKKQIAEGGPVTVTHKDMTRYFMAISEAVALVLMAGTLGKGGEIFLLDMGKPVKILDVAEALIRRSGLEPNKDVDIVFSGIRPGEKLYEELFWYGEGIVPTEHKEITMLKPDLIDYAEWLDRVNMLELDFEVSNTENVIRHLQGLVKDFTAFSPDRTESCAPNTQSI